MSARFHPARVYSGLKVQFRLLVDTCGGPNSAERVTRISQQQISRCSSIDEEHASRFPPADAIVDLEAHCGKPILTEYLAEQAGYVLVRMPRADSPSQMALVSRVADMLREVSDVSSGVADALRDNKVTRGEARAVHKEVREALKKLVELDNAMALMVATSSGDDDDE